MSDATPPTLHVIAGPNGSGKSTLTSGLLSRVRVPIIDPDAIARSLRPTAPEAVAVEAGREALRRQQHYLRHHTGFAIETTLAGHVTLRLMEQARAYGFAVHLIYICLDSVETNIGRVEQRVRHGGHHVPDDDVRRRYA